MKGYARTGGFYGRFSGGAGGAVGGEYKFHDVNADDAVIANTGSILTSLTLIAQGVTESTRVGRKCTIRSISWRGDITLPTTATAAETGDVVRMMLILDTQANGDVPVTADILQTGVIYSYMFLANSTRFKVLKTFWLTMSSPAGSGRGSTDTLSYAERFKRFAFFKRCNIPIEYSGTTGVLTEIKSNNLIIFTISRSGFASLISKVRLRFSDA